MEVYIKTYEDWNDFIYNYKEYNDFLNCVIGRIAFYYYDDNGVFLTFIPNSVYGEINNRNVHIFYNENEIRILHSDNIYFDEEINRLIVIAIPEFCQAFMSIINKKIPEYSKKVIEYCPILLGCYLDIENPLNFTGVLIFKDFIYRKTYFDTYVNLNILTEKSKSLLNSAIKWRKSILLHL